MASAWIAVLQSHDAAGVVYINTLGVKMDPVAGDGLNPTDLADECYSWFGAEYRAILGEGLQFDTLTVEKMPSGSGIVGVHPVNLAGTVAEGSSRPREICYILSWKTDVATRSGRGHIAVSCPLVDSLYSGQSFNMGAAYFASGAVPAFLAKLDAGHDWLTSGVTDGHLSHIVYSRKHDSYADVKARIIRSKPRWLERRQTAP